MKVLLFPVPLQIMRWSRSHYRWSREGIPDNGYSKSKDVQAGLSRVMKLTLEIDDEYQK